MYVFINIFYILFTYIIYLSLIYFCVYCFFKVIEAESETKIVTVKGYDIQGYDLQVVYYWNIHISINYDHYYNVHINSNIYSKHQSMFVSFRINHLRWLIMFCQLYLYNQKIKYDICFYYK